MSDEINLPDDEETVYIYGIEMPVLPEGLQPLECVVLIQGINMENGQPTITAMGSENMTPWTAVGMLRMEATRLETGYTFGGLGTGFDEEDEDS